MLKVNVDDVPWKTYVSPKGKFRGGYQELTVALGAKPDANQFNGGYPFDLAIEKLAPGESLCPYHDHALQYELFYILSGSGTVRSSGESHSVKAGDVVMHPPGDAHQITNSGTEDLTYIFIADNPPLDVCRYPDSDKVGIFDGASRRDIVRTTAVDYWDGEE